MNGIDWNKIGCRYMVNMREQGYIVNECRYHPLEARADRDIAETTYCSKHQPSTWSRHATDCPKAKCTNHKLKEEKFCKSCTCEIDGCSRQRTPDSNICSKHNCIRCGTFILYGRFIDGLCKEKCNHCEDVNEKIKLLRIWNTYKKEWIKYISSITSRATISNFLIEPLIFKIYTGSINTEFYKDMLNMWIQQSDSQVETYLLKSTHVDTYNNVLGLITRCAILLPKGIFEIILSYL